MVIAGDGARQLAEQHRRADARQHRHQGPEAPSPGRKPGIGQRATLQAPGPGALGSTPGPAALMPPLQADRAEHQAGDQRQDQGGQGDQGQDPPARGRQILRGRALHGQGGVAEIQLRRRAVFQHQLQQLQNAQPHAPAEDPSQHRRRQGHRSGAEQEIGMHVPPGSAHADHGAAHAPLAIHQQIAEQHQKAQTHRQAHTGDDLHHPQHILQRLGHGGVALVVYGDLDGAGQLLLQPLHICLGLAVPNLQLPQGIGAVVHRHVHVLPHRDIHHGVVFLVGGENAADGIGVLGIEALTVPIAVGDQGVLPDGQGQGQTAAHVQPQVIGQRLGNQAALAAGGVIVPLDQGQLILLEGQQVRRAVRGLGRQAVAGDLEGLAHGLDIGAAVQLGAGAVGLGDVDGADLAQGHAVDLIGSGGQQLIGRAQQLVFRVYPLDQIVVPGLPDGVRGHIVILAQVGATALLHVQQHRLIRSQPLTAEQGFDDVGIVIRQLHLPVRGTRAPLPDQLTVRVQERIEIRVLALDAPGGLLRQPDHQRKAVFQHGVVRQRLQRRGIAQGHAGGLPVHQGRVRPVQLAFKLRQDLPGVRHHLGGAGIARAQILHQPNGGVILPALAQGLLQGEAQPQGCAQQRHQQGHQQQKCHRSPAGAQGVLNAVSGKHTAFPPSLISVM